MEIGIRSGRRGITEIYPRFKVVNPSKHLMIRGGGFYAIWDEEHGRWSTNEQTAIDIIDKDLDKYAQENGDKYNGYFRILHVWDAETGMIDRWHKFCKDQMQDTFHMLDESIVFANTKTTINDYSSKRLPYPLEEGDISAWDKLVSVLYNKEERQKIEWMIGAIVSGASRKLQKFVVFYGAAGTGKSTIIEIIDKLFEGYTGVFRSKALGASSNDFALEDFKSNPLVAIEHDGDLSKIEDNTRLNSLVSHEKMTVNEKYRSTYMNKFKCFLIMGTNRPVKITDAKSGLLRRLIDISPTGNKVSRKEYDQLMSQIGFELGAIAYHCRNVYYQNEDFYDNYVPLNMISSTNDFYNFVMDSWPIFDKENGTTLKIAWAMYKEYCSEANVPYPYTQRVFKEELKNYFDEYIERGTTDGVRTRNSYYGFKRDKFESSFESKKTQQELEYESIKMKQQASLLDEALKDCPAQYANADEAPYCSWSKVHTRLKDLDTKRLHYVRPPLNLIVIDFDIRNENGEKDFNKNIEEASKWPKTYAEVSKSGGGIHLHYYYSGDVSTLSGIYDNYIEIKVFTGLSSLRRKLSICNNEPIATLTHGLPLKEVKKIINYESVQSEKSLRNLIIRNLNKEIHHATKPSIDFIFKILDDAYHSDLKYDVSDTINIVTSFAAKSSHNAAYCLNKVNKMHFKSDEPTENTDNAEAPIVFYDVEVFPNLFLVNWKFKGEGKPVVRMINPSPMQIEELTRYRLIGFNCRRYDNHILYARMLGYSNLQLFNLSQAIVSGGKRNAVYFGEAYNLSYTDVYDFASAGNKKSLKKFEIELGIHHHELGLPWDKPVPEDQWGKVAAYCDDDVIATEAVFDHLSADWTARQILADIAGMTVNDTTNSLTTRIIFDRVREPQGEFNYRNLAEPVKELRQEVIEFLKNAKPEMMSELHGEEHSLLPYFKGYLYKDGVSTYRGETIGEGGKVYAEPGMYTNVALLDIASMHPNSIIAEVLFGVRFTKRFKEIVDGRVSIKHKAWEDVNDILDGKLTPYIQKVKDGIMTSKDLANALKTAINSVYGLTSAAFANAFKDPRNKDNIVAKRGALFMTDLKYEVQQRGFKVIHIKTDSIKIPDATKSIIDFVVAFGKKYGYVFEHEATYEKLCIVNDAVYIAKHAKEQACEEMYGYVPDDNKGHEGTWTATGKQFKIPYVFKRLFSHEPIVFSDMCETFSVSGSLYLDMNEDLPDVSTDEKELAKILKKNGLSHMDLMDFKELGHFSSLSPDVSSDEFEMDIKNRLETIDKGHAYRFVGKVGEFTPISSGHGGGKLMREADGKYSAATGSIGYRWMESELVKNLGFTDCVDLGYYRKLADDAVDTISKYGDFEWFVA